jgi:hypothetical protein
VRRLAPLLLILALLTQVYAQPAIPRHVNPEQLKPITPDPAILTAVYESLSRAFLAENFSGVAYLASTLLNLSAPSDLKFILDRFHSLIQEEGALLNYSKAGLEAARQLALQGRALEALAHLENVTLHLAKANITYLSLADAARAIRGRVGAETGGLLQSLLKLIGTYARRLNETGTLLGANLTDTQLTLSITPTTAWVGSRVLAYGYLRTWQGDPLPHRRVVLVLEGREVAEATTDEQGYYSLALQAPYIYVERVHLLAMYLPSGDDFYKYKPATSPNATLYLLFVTPNITLSIHPDVVLPGDTIELRVSLDAPVPVVDAYAFGEHFQLQVLNGSAALTLSVPADALEGRYVVVVSSPANGTIAPASARGTVTVRKLSLNISQLQVPMLLSPLTTTAAVCVSSEGEPTPYLVEVSIPSAGVQASKTSSSACTQVEITPGALTPTGPLEGTIAVQPLDPRYKPAYARFQVYNLNLILVALAMALVLSTLSAYLRVRARGGRPQAKEEEEKPAVTPLVVPETSPPRAEAEAAPPEPMESGDPVVREYFRAVKLVESATGVRMKPSHTISEYLSETWSRLGKAGEVFREISRLAEDRLYGDIPVDANKLRYLVSALEKILKEQQP